MNFDHPGSPAQLFGYLALVLAVAAFLQKRDRRLKFLIATECVVYAVHFWLLHNLPASTSSLVSSVRTYTSMVSRSKVWAAVFIAANAVLGAGFARHPAGWIPVIGSCLGTYAVFMLAGIPMRVVLLVCTVLWLTNNILSGSIGGTVLESIVAGVNLTTICRLVRGGRPVEPPPGATGPEPVQSPRASG